jgi:hypothetical protein
VFTYAIAQRNINEVRVNLMYDGNIVNGAIAEGTFKQNILCLLVISNKFIYWLENLQFWVVSPNSAYRYMFNSKYITFKY